MATMQVPGQTLATDASAFIDRRSNAGGSAPSGERRQFTNTHDELSPEAAELASAVDGYKLLHRRRFINYEEVLAVVKSLGYKR